MEVQDEDQARTIRWETGIGPNRTRTPSVVVGTPAARPVVRRPKPLVDVQKRKAYIRPGTTNVLEPSGDCTRWITAKFHEKLDSALTWGKVSEEQKNNYFLDFAKGFEWDPREEAAIRKAWFKKAAKSYAQLT